jgi:hypothetical protein
MVGPVHLPEGGGDLDQIVLRPRRKTVTSGAFNSATLWRRAADVFLGDEVRGSNGVGYPGPLSEGLPTSAAVDGHADPPPPLEYLATTSAVSAREMLMRRSSVICRARR